MIRAFVGLRPPDAVCDRLEGLADDLDEGRPVAWDNLHMTLAFLGEHPTPVLEDVAAELLRVDGPHPEVRLEGLDLFGGDRPRSVHVRARPDPALSALREAVRRAARRGGVDLPRERFIPHVTVVRFGPRTPAGEGFARWLARNASFACAAWPAREAVLWRSDLGKEGPVYSELMSFPLA